MKKLIYASILGLAVFTACGPSAEQKAAKEKATADSLAAVATADSLAKATAEATAKVAEEARLKAYNDSVASATATAEAEAAAKTSKPSKKK